MDDTPEPVVGLVLSGGGATVGFQVGALRYLYDVVGIAPTVIAGTSAGSILAALLAQADDYAGQRRILGQIEEQYETLRYRSDIMIELEWFTELQKLAPALQRVAEARASHPQAMIRPALPPTRSRRWLGNGRPGGTGEPGIRLPHWDSTPVRETLSAIWSVGRARPDFDALLRGGRQEQSLYRRGPIFGRLLGPEIFDPARLARSATELRVAVVALESGELRYVTGRGVLVDRADQPVPGEGQVPLVDAVHASCAIPAIYRPVPLGAEHYVDGGTRENLPVDIAMAHLGATRCYAVNSRPTGVSVDTNYDGKDMLAIMLRATAGIMSDEVQLSGVARARAHGAVLIAPEVDVLEVWEVDPGLLAIARDYGYLRAAEACEEASQSDQRVTRDAIELRRRIWKEENAFVAARTADSSIGPSAELSALKGQLRDLVAHVPPGRLPPGAAQWWLGWERHLVEIEDPITWVAEAPPAQAASTS